MLTPGQTLSVEFTTRSPTTGGAVDADSLPAGTLIRNGVATVVTVTPEKTGTGIYKAVVVIPGSYVAGDVVQIRIAATVEGVADNFSVWGETLAPGGAGGGARTVNVTVTDGTDPIEGATVRFTNGAESYALETDADGEAVFALDDATWSVAVTKPLYSFTPTTLVVDGPESPTYSMVGQSIPAPGTDLQTIAYLTTYDAHGEIAGGVVVAFYLSRSDGTAGRGYNSAAVTATSDEAGLLTVSLLKNTTYRAGIGSSPQKQFTTGSDDSFAIPEIVGIPDAEV